MAVATVAASATGAQTLPSGRWDSEVDSVLYCCNPYEVRATHDRLGGMKIKRSAEEQNVWYAQLMRLCIRLSAPNAINDYINALNTNEVYSFEGSKEIVKACNDYIQYSEFCGNDIDIKKLIPTFDKSSGNPIFNTAEYSCLLGYVNRHLHSYNEAVKSFNEALAFCDGGVKNASMLSVRYDVLLGLAQSYIDLGNYEQAFEVLKRFDTDALELSPSRVLMARRGCVEGVLLNNLGDNRKSEECLSAAMTSLIETKELSSFVVCEIVYALAKTQMALGEYEAALKTLDTLDNTLQKHYPGKSSMWIDAQAMRMNAKIAMGLYEDALEIEEYAKVEKLDLKGNPTMILNIAEVNNAWAECLIRDGFPSVAASMLEISAGLYEDLDVDNAVARRNLYNRLGYALTKSEKGKEAAKSFAKQLDIDRRFAHDVFMFLPEARRAAYWAQTEPLMNRLFMLNQHGSVTLPDGTVSTIKSNKGSGDVGSLLYDASLLNKGLMLQTSVNMKKLVADKGDGEVEKMLARMVDIRNRQAAGARISEAEKIEAERLEKQLMQRSREYGDYMQFTSMSWSDVRDRLARNEVAVEFVMSRDNGVQYYSAELLRNNMKHPEHIFLFGIKENNKSFDRENIYESTFLYNKVWKRVLEHCKPGETIYFSPAGKLYSIAIEHAAMPDGGRINTLYNPVRLSSTRELARSETNALKSDVALYGGLNYDMSVYDMELMAMENQVKRGRMRGALVPGVEERTAWQYLPGTFEEVSAIAAGWKKRKGSALHVVSGTEGTEENFKALSGGNYDILHIATHGFYLPAQHDSNEVLRSAFVNSDESLLRSALVLSGGNNGWLRPERIPEGVDDGVMTAKEISEMDLSGTSLVVMSACQTGLGDISNEGVFGLQRAFKLAGVRSLMMSLAPVHDDATRVLMTEFYAGLNGGLTKREAFRRAQDAVRAAQFEVDGELRAGSEPRFWAPFVLMD